MPNTPDERLTILERAQENLARAQQLHADVLAQHAVWHKDHREHMAKLDENHQVLLEMLARMEEKVSQHDEHMARLDVLLQAIKELLERGHNGH